MITYRFKQLERSYYSSPLNQGDYYNVDFVIDKFNREFHRYHVDNLIRKHSCTCCPSPAREQKSLDSSNMHICPNSRIINKFCKATGKTEKIIITCGKCYYCRHKRQNQLIFRIYKHKDFYEHSLFVTLTYNNAHYPLYPDFAKRDLLDDAQLFYKRLRKHFNPTGGTFTYYHIGEKGKKSGRLHHHFLIFWNGIDVSTVKQWINESWTDVPRSFDSIGDIPFLERYERSSIGYTYFGEVSGKSIAYCTKYMNKGSNELTVFQTWSKGLGAGILDDDYWKQRLRYQSVIDYQPDPEGKRYYISVPRYYKNKVLREDERDRIFADYLKSADYYSLLCRVQDDTFMNNVQNHYDLYVVSCDERQQVRDKERQQRKTDI